MCVVIITNMFNEYGFFFLSTILWFLNIIFAYMYKRGLYTFCSLYSEGIGYIDWSIEKRIVHRFIIE